MMLCRIKNVFAVISVFVFILMTADAKSKKVSKESLMLAAKAMDETSEAEGELSAEEQWQLIEWDDSRREFVLNYEIEIEVYDEKERNFNPLFVMKTEDNADSIHINPQLEPGFYRYRLIPYNLLGLRGHESNWITFSIVEAYQPVINSLTSNSSKGDTIYLDEWNDGKFSVNGRNLFEPQKRDSDTKYTEYAFVNRKKTKLGVVKPDKIENKSDRNLELYVDIKNLEVGTYDFVATDASGLESEKGNHSVLNVKYRKWMDFDISGGYVLPCVLFDDTIPNYMGSNIWPISAYGKVSLLPVKRSFGNFGLGITGSFTRMSVEYDRYKIDGNMITGFANIIYQIPVYFHRKDPEKRRHRLTFELHGGAGGVYLMDYQFHFDNGIESKKMNSIITGFDAGVAVQGYITNRLFIELNADGILGFGKDVTLGMILPGVGIGWQF